MKPVMSVVCLLFVFVSGLNVESVFAQSEKMRAQIRQDVKEMNEGVMQGKFDRVIDLTHPEIVKKMGGREAMKIQIRQVYEQMKGQGISIESSTAGEPSEFVTNANETYVMVPFELKMKFPGARMTQDGYVIGISTNQGKNWTYVNGSVKEDQLKLFLPNLPENLKLPEKTEPIFEQIEEKQ